MLVLGPNAVVKGLDELDAASSSALVGGALDGWRTCS